MSRSDPPLNQGRAPTAGTKQILPAPRAATTHRAKIWLVLLGTAVGLAVAEIVLHFALPSYGYRFPSFRITDDRFAKRAGQIIDGNGVRYAFDADGFRKSGASSPAGARTVLFIGDSFTQGFGVNEDETFPAVTCDRLARQGVGARCLNAGVSGFGTAHELRLLQTLLHRDGRAVDAVVLQVLPNNDLRDNWEDGGFGVEDGKLVVRDPPRIPLAVRLRDALVDNAWARGSRIVAMAANAWFNGTGMELHYDAAAVQLEQRLLQEVVATAQRRGVHIVIAVCATRWEVDRVRSQPYDERDRLDLVVATVQQLQVPWIDSRNVARAPEDYNADGHFSAAGNAAIGAALAEKLAPLLHR